MAELDYATKARANTGIGFGIAGLATALAGGAAGMLFNGGHPSCFENQYVSRYDAEKDAKISKLEQTVALGEAEKYTDQKMIDVYSRITERILSNERSYAEDKAAQAVFNAQVTSNMAVSNNNIMSLQSQMNNITKTIVPSSAICPTPMPLYNNWKAPEA